MIPPRKLVIKSIAQNSRIPLPPPAPLISKDTKMARPLHPALHPETSAAGTGVVPIAIVVASPHAASNLAARPSQAPATLSDCAVPGNEPAPPCPGCHSPDQARSTARRTPKRFHGVTARELLSGMVCVHGQHYPIGNPITAVCPKVGRAGACAGVMRT